jgi:hypothetical protein
MYQRILIVMISLVGVAGAQAIPQRATIVGGGNPSAGQCTITVTVDGNAQVDVLGADGMLRNLGGAAPRWGRFECTVAMPSNPPNFQFTAVNGRGHQNLTAEARNGGPAVVRIEDPEGGAGEYTFRLTWNNGPAAQDRGVVGTRDNRGYQGGSQGDRSSQRDRGTQVDPAYPGNRAYQGNGADQGDRGFRGDRGEQADRGQQGRGGEDLDSYHRDRDNSFRDNGGRAMFFQRIREDLDHATSGAFPFTGDRARLQRTQMELNDLQQKLAKGYYDERELDQTMAALQAVVQGNRLAPRDRAMLTEDLSRMRDFRARHDQYGAR